MAKPLLTEKQKKATLRNKKGNKETLKNVLVCPYTSYWPLLKSEDESVINEVLKGHVPKLQQCKISVPYSKIRNVPKEERKSFRNNYVEGDFTLPDKQIKESLVFGINEVTKLLEKNDASSVLLTSDVVTRLMVKHVVDLAVLHKIPILVVPKLRELLRDFTGIRSVAMALRKSTKVNSDLSVIQSTIRSVYKNYPVPRNHINFNRSGKSFFNVSCLSDRIKCKSKLVSTENSTDLPDGMENFNEDLVSNSSSDLSEDHEQVPDNTEKYYLYRNSRLEKVFVPELSQRENLTEDKQVEDYLSLSSTGGSNVLQKNGETKYKSLVVNRIRSNKNRNKKKIALLKKKRLN